MRAVAALLLAAAVVGAAGCGGSDASDASIAPVELSPLTTVTTTSQTPVTTAPSPATTAQATTTTVAPTTLPPSTTQAAVPPPCDLDLIVQQTETAYEGITPGDLRCAGVWASWVGRPDDAMASDGFFAVARWDRDAWVLENLGSAEICGAAGVPAELWDDLQCIE